MHRRHALKILSGLALMPTLTAFPPVLAQGPRVSGNIGINLAGLSYWGNEQPFTNLSTAASPWRSQRIGAPFSWDYPLPPMSADGYPLSVPTGTYLESFLIHTPHREHLPRDLVVVYDGVGRLDYDGATVTARAPGQDHIRDVRRGGAISARITKTESGNPLKNLRLYPADAVPGDHAIFRPAFLQRWGAMSALRFMDWMDTNNSKIVSWAQRPAFQTFSQSRNGVALEYMIELANRLQVAPWFTMPHMADDDYVRQFARQVRQDLDPELSVYVEYSNEVWNGTFDQADYARQAGLRAGLSSNEFEAQLRFYSQRSTEVIGLWEEAFVSSKDRVLGVYASQSVNEWSSEVILSWGRARQHADVLAIAPYFGGAFGSPERAAEVSTWSLDDLFEALSEEIDGENKAVLQKQAAMAKAFNIELVAYEGGQHLVGYHGMENNERLQALFHEANRDPRMGKLYERHLMNWWAAGGGLYTLFNSVSGYSKWGSWGLLETESSEPNSPKWHAVSKLLQS